MPFAWLFRDGSEKGRIDLRYRANGVETPMPNTCVPTARPKLMGHPPGIGNPRLRPSVPTAREVHGRWGAPQCLEFRHFGGTLALPSSEALSEALSAVSGSLLEPRDHEPRVEGARKPVEFPRWRGSVHSVAGSVACHRGSGSVRQSFRQSFRRRLVDEFTHPITQLEPECLQHVGFVKSGDTRAEFRVCSIQR